MRKFSFTTRIELTNERKGLKDMTEFSRLAWVDLKQLPILG